MTTRVRLGLVGTENSHAQGIVEYLNADGAGAGARVVALAGGPTRRNQDLARLGAIPRIVEEPEQLMGSIDALILATRDGRLHRQQALPFLRAGVPVWIDKPLACSRADASDILDAASAARTHATSSSALRWTPDALELLRAREGVGELQTVTLIGPADARSPYGGIFFYGVHVADVARMLAPGPAGEVSVQRVAQTIRVQYRTAGPLVTLDLVEPPGDGRTPFWATLVGRRGVESRELRLGEGYVRPGVDVFLRMLSTGCAPLTREEMLDPISVLEQVAAVIGDVAPRAGTTDAGGEPGAVPALARLKADG